MASKLALSRKGWTVVGIVAGVLLVSAIVMFVVRRNDVVPNEKKMSRVMADVYTADALLQYDGSIAAGKRVAEELYHTILEQYGMTKADYDSAVTWYSRHPAEYSEVYERTVAILSSREAVFKRFAEQRDSLTKRIKFINDSVRVSLGKWPKFVRMPLGEKDTISRYVRPSLKHAESIDLEFDIDSRSGGFLTYTSRYSFPKGLGDGDTICTVLSVGYSDGSRDSVVNILAHNRTLSGNDLTLPLDTTKTATKARLRMACGKALKESNMLMQDFALSYMPFIVPDSSVYEIEQPPLFAY